MIAPNKERIMDNGEKEDGHEGHDHAEGDLDCCLSDIPLGEDEATRDEDLPPTTGGVEE